MDKGLRIFTHRIPSSLGIITNLLNFDPTYRRVPSSRKQKYLYQQALGMACVSRAVVQDTKNMCGPVLSLFGDLMGDYCGLSCLYIFSFPLDRYSSMPFLGLCLDLSNNLFKLGSLSILLPPEPGPLPWDFYNIISNALWTPSQLLELLWNNILHVSLLIPKFHVASLCMKSDMKPA